MKGEPVGVAEWDESEKPGVHKAGGVSRVARYMAENVASAEIGAD